MEFLGWPQFIGTEIKALIHVMHTAFKVGQLIHVIHTLLSSGS